MDTDLGYRLKFSVTVASFAGSADIGLSLAQPMPSTCKGLIRAFPARLVIRALGVRRIERLYNCVPALRTAIAKGWFGTNLTTNHMRSAANAMGVFGISN